MRVLFVEAGLIGHGEPQIISLAKAMNALGHDVAIHVPKDIEINGVQTFVCTSSPSARLLRCNPKTYYSWIRDIEQSANRFNADVIHFLTADYLYPMCGWMLKRLGRQFPLIGTFHLYRPNPIRKLGAIGVVPCMAASITYASAVQESFIGILGKAPVLVDCPVWEDLACSSVQEERHRWGAPSDVKLIAALGGTRRTKGVDLLLQALASVREPFNLLIAGSEEEITQEEIESLSSSFNDSVKTRLEFLTEEEFVSAAQAADIIALPYRRNHTGASGPMATGVALGKVIVGPSCGSIGSCIEQHHLGYTFVPEDTDDLARALETALREEFEFDGEYHSYQKRLDPVFCAQRISEVYRNVIAARKRKGVR